MSSNADTAHCSRDSLSCTLTLTWTIQRDAGLRSAGLKITSEGEIPAEEIDRRQLIDKHYYAIASKATLLKPDQLNVPEAQFEKQFGEKTNN